MTEGCIEVIEEVIKVIDGVIEVIEGVREMTGEDGWQGDDEMSQAIF